MSLDSERFTQAMVPTIARGQRMDAPELPAPLAPPSATWDESRTPHVVLRAAPSSYATQVLDALLERAERTWQRGSEWLGGDAASPPVTVYLVDWLDEATHPGWTRLDSAEPLRKSA